MRSKHSQPLFLLTALCLSAGILSACGDKSQAKPAGAGHAPEVSVVKIAPERLGLLAELPGRLEAKRIAQVRARVAGVVLNKSFHEGGGVKAGQVLFRIDPAPFQAAANSAQALLAKAQANQAQANLKVQRYRPLVEAQAVSRQEFDEALTAQLQANAEVAAARAALETANLNLAYATVTAPISGTIGRALVTEGALVGQGEATPLAVVQQTDPMLVTLTQSSAEVLRLRRALASGQLKKAGKGQAKVTLITEDGQVYPHAGKLLFSDLTVDEGTGAILMRAEFPNPQHALLPGMFVRARLEQAVNEQAITVPQQAVMRGTDGAFVYVIDAQNQVQVQPVTTDAAQADQWIITQGLKAGDQVIVDGLQKLKPGMPVKPVAWPGAAAPAAATPKAN